MQVPQSGGSGSCRSAVKSMVAVRGAQLEQFVVFLFGNACVGLGNTSATLCANPASLHTGAFVGLLWCHGLGLVGVWVLGRHGASRLICGGRCGCTTVLGLASSQILPQAGRREAVSEGAQCYAAEAGPQVRVGICSNR